MYLILKLLHVAGVVLFLGNITVGVFWKQFSDRTRDAAVMAFAMDGIVRADRIFTIPGVILLLGAGLAAAFVGGIPILSTGWLLWGIIAFILAGLAFIAARPGAAPPRHGGARRRSGRIRPAIEELELLGITRARDSR